MAADEAKAAIAGFAAANRIRFVDHARDQMTAPRITYRDVRNVLVNATACGPSDDGPGRWLVRGADLDGEDTKVVCVIEDGVVVITVF
jgi:hypothetical protein